jgi:peptidoglycan hydrolase-like protein with peptidoglycan-binding domain
MLGGAALVVAATAAGVAAVTSGGGAASPTGQEAVHTVPVQRGTLSSLVSGNGILTHRARADGSPYAVISRATGTYTALPEVGAEVGCGDELYRVDDRPVLLLCGVVPAYRDLQRGDAGNDVRQLNQNLHQLGKDAGAGIDPDDDVFTWKTAEALEVLQHDKGVDPTGELALADAAFLPEPLRVAEVTGELGGPTQPGAPVAEATSGALVVHLDLDPSQQGVLQPGDAAQITLPGNRAVAGKVERLGSVVAGPAGPNGEPGDPIIPVSIGLDDPATARGLEEVAVQVDIRTTGVEDALSVPVTAIVGRSGGGFAVEVVRAGGRRDLVAVVLGLFDTTAGRVQVEGELRVGDDVVVPSL